MIGGGVMGLWAAWEAARAGIDTLLADATGPGVDKASLTPVGALIPFAHEPKDPRLADFQAAALRAMPAAVARLEAAADQAVGYRVAGRLIPLADEAAAARAAEVTASGATRYPVGPTGEPGGWRVADAVDADMLAGMVAPGERGSGVLVEHVSAQVDTVALLAALRRAVERDARLIEGARIDRLSATAEGWHADGPAGAIEARRVVLAAGWQSTTLGATAGGDRSAGMAALRPVRGQAAWLRAAPGVLDDAMPIIHAAPLYVAHHGGGRVGIGATTEPGETAGGTDGRLDDVITLARRVVPALETAKVEARWSAVRPRPPGTMPQIGPVPEACAGAPGLWLATGTYKIGVALAHHAAAGLAASLLSAEAVSGRVDGLPAAFAPGADSDGRVTLPQRQREA